MISGGATQTSGRAGNVSVNFLIGPSKAAALAIVITALHAVAMNYASVKLRGALTFATWLAVFFPIILCVQPIMHDQHFLLGPWGGAG